MNRGEGTSALARCCNALLSVAAVLGVVSILLGVSFAAFGIQPLVVKSASMEPSLPTGALALAKETPAAELEVGDVVSVIDAAGRRVTHRVAEVARSGGQTSLVLKGDANASVDPAPYTVVTVDRVALDVPQLGRAVAWVNGRGGLALGGAILVGLLVATVARPRPRPRHAQVAGAAVTVLGLGLVVAVPPPVATDAYFSDEAGFQAGTMLAHQVQAFDWAATPCVQSGSGGTSITLNYLVKDPRYTMVWDRFPEAGGVGTRIKAVAPTGAPGTAVATPFTGAELSPGLSVAGTYRLVGSSKLRGAATAEWLSSVKRDVLFTITGLGAGSTVLCGSVNIGPSIVFTAPTSDSTYYSQSSIDSAVRAACSNLAAPCGTASDQDGIRTIEYRLQRVNLLGVQCWDPGALFGATYTYGGCGTWRPASTAPALPTTAGSAVTWRVPLGSAGSTFGQTGTYTLSVRVTDNATPSATSESTITFTRVF